MRTDTPTYNNVAIVLHWLIALLVICMFFFGLYAEEAKEALVENGTGTREQVVMLFNWHKTFGLLVLVLVLARLGWRLVSKTPPMSDGLSKVEVFLSKAAHVIFYVLLIGIPLSGWLIMSTSTSPSFFFNVTGLEIPKIWGPSEELHETMEEVHELGAYFIMGLLVFHVAAALKHHFWDKADTLARMLPWVKPRS